MKNTGTIVLGIALAAVGGLFGASVTGQLFDVNQNSQLDSSAYMLGHIEFTVTDEFGNIKDYRQTDNLILNDGENCVLKALFGSGGPTTTSSASGGGCTGAVTEGYNYIAIGNATADVVTGGASELGISGADSAIDTEITGNGMARTQATTITLTNSTADAADGAGGATAVLSHTFTASALGATGTVDVDNSGLFNGTASTTDGIFSWQEFDEIPIGNGDSLTVEWTIEIGGGTVDT